MTVEAVPEPPVPDDPKAETAGSAEARGASPEARGAVEDRERRPTRRSRSRRRREPRLTGRYARLARVLDVLAVVVVLVLAGYRWKALGAATYPGHADPAFYYDVARRLHDGKGPTINYIWEFLSRPDGTTHYAFGYWLPLQSVFMSWALSFHDSLRAAMGVNVVMSVLVSLGTWLLARRVTRSWWVPAAAAAIIAVQPVVTSYTVRAEPPLLYGAAALFAFVAMADARRRPWLWPVAGILVAAANLARSEGLLLVPVLLVAAALARSSSRRAWKQFLGALAGYVAGMLPFWVMSIVEYGSPMPRASSSLPFARTFEQLFAVSIDHNVDNLLGGGVKHFVYVRVSALSGVFVDGQGALNLVVLIVCLLLAGGLVVRGLAHRTAATDADSAADDAATTPTTTSESRRRQRAADRPSWPERGRSYAESPWFAPVFFAVVLIVFYVLAVPALVIVNAAVVEKASVPVVAALIVAALTALSRVRGANRLKIVIPLVLLLVPIVGLAKTTRSTIASQNAFGVNARGLLPMLQAEQRCLGRPAILMTRNPWEISQVTGFTTVQIPYGDLATILQTARRYGVTDILLDPAHRPVLADVAALTKAGGPLQRIQTFPGRAIYRFSSIEPKSPISKCQSI